MLPEPKSILSVDKLADDYGDTYPGFPWFVHLIMAHVGMGKTHEEAAALVRTDDITAQVDDLLNHVKLTTATRDENGEVVLPEYARIVTDSPSNILPSITEAEELNRSYESLNLSY
jgi:hypothetical protein